MKTTKNKKPKWLLFASLVAVFAVFAAACDDDDETSSATTTTTAAPDSEPDRPRTGTRPRTGARAAHDSGAGW